MIKAHYMASAIKLELVWKSFTFNPSDKSMLLMQNYSYCMWLNCEICTGYTFKILCKYLSLLIYNILFVGLSITTWKKSS